MSQKKANIELLFNEDGSGAIYMNYWECGNGREINCEIKGDQIYKFVHNTSENEELEKSDMEYDPFKQTEISLGEFVKMVKQRIPDSE